MVYRLSLSLTDIKSVIVSINQRIKILYNDKIGRIGTDMKKFPSIKSNSDFKKIYNNSDSYANKLFVMYKKKNNRKNNRIGISVSKKVGNSVIRHRITRQIREIFRLHQNILEQGYDIIIIVRIASVNKTYKEKTSAFIHLCRLHKILIQ